MTKEYICECGKVFTSSQKYGGHSTHCIAHLKANDLFDKSYHNPDVKEKLKEQAKQDKLNQWISEQHTCEKCGKIMIEKFGSGRFCSKSCANGHKKSEASKHKVSQTLNNIHKMDKINGTDKRTQNELIYYSNPNKCVVCNEILDYEKRDRRTCSKECALQLQSITMTNVLAQKGLHRTVPKRYKYGTYKGVHCDSSWELAFLIYNLEHNRDIKRCEEHFEYILDGHRHNYFPDFIMEDVYYEIKNYYTNTVYAKIKQFPSNKRLVIIDGKQIHKYLNYCKNKYGDSFYHIYDRSCPSWMD